MLARNSFFIGPLIGRDGCRPEVFFLALSISSFLLGPHAEYLGVIPQYLTAPPYSLYCSRTLDSGCISHNEWIRYKEQPTHNRYMQTYQICICVYVQLFVGLFIPQIHIHFHPPHIWVGLYWWGQLAVLGMRAKRAKYFGCTAVNGLVFVSSLHAGYSFLLAQHCLNYSPFG